MASIFLELKLSTSVISCIIENVFKCYISSIQKMWQEMCQKTCLLFVSKIKILFIQFHFYQIMALLKIAKQSALLINISVHILVE